MDNIGALNLGKFIPMSKVGDIQLINSRMIELSIIEDLADLVDNNYGLRFKAWPLHESRMQIVKELE